MNPEKFGDSYDIVKKEIIHGLAPADEWAVHPMYFAQCPDMDFLNQYKRFLGIGLVDGHNYVRENVGEIGALCPSHLFLDPDTGLWVPGVGGVQRERPRRGWNKHIRVEEIVQIASAQGRKSRLTLVYDQCYANATFENLKEQAQEKLGELRDHGLYGAAYVSHAVFIWVSADQDTVIAATNRLIACSRLPRWRFVGEGV